MEDPSAFFAVFVVKDCLLVCEMFQVLVEGRAKSRAAVLNRSSALNSLTASMVYFFLFLFSFFYLLNSIF